MKGEQAISAQVIDGKKMATEIAASLAERTESLRTAGVVPGLVVFLIGDDHASRIYVRNKDRTAQEVGINTQVIRLAANIRQAEVLSLIGRYNADPAVHGIMIQSPVPEHLDFDALVNAIAPAKDVDGFHPLNLGRLARGRPFMISCTARGVMEMLRREGVETRGKHAVVVGRSITVGRPMSLLLLAADATVTTCHRWTENLAEHTHAADILVVAAGKAGLITGDMVKEGATVIDVGINRVDDRVVGDVDFGSVAAVAGRITPVPRGVGPMTVAMLMQNTIEAAEVLR